MIAVDVFLSAYDPSDLPGESIDPLGFERGYLHLAEKILPGLTNVANRPRYFGVLCAGAQLAGVDGAASPRALYLQRLDTLLRLERLWALANVLAAREVDDGFEHDLSGVRGLRYVERKARALADKNEARTSADFPVLARQAPYGVVGIYGAVGERLRFLQDRKTLTLTPDLGDRLAEAFMTETAMPSEVRHAVVKNQPVAVRTLAAWGRNAHVSGEYGKEEAKCLAEALHWNALRSRMANLLASVPSEAEETELERLDRIRKTIRHDETQRDLTESISAILAYERAYSLAQLGLDRILWLCRSTASVRIDDAGADSVMKLVRTDIVPAAQRLDSAIGGASSPHFRTDVQRLDDTRSFVLALAAAAASPRDFVGVIMTRHADVQRGKFDRGHRKTPWVEASGDTLSLTTTRVGGTNAELQDPSEIVPHYYRTAAADALLVAAEAA